MANEKDRQLARYYYVEKWKTAKETAEAVGVTEAPMSKWVKRFGWKAEREARALSSGERIDKIRNIISDLARQRMELASELRQAEEDGDKVGAGMIRSAMAAIDDGVAKWNKVLDSAKKETEIRLTVYLEVMDRIFAALRDYDHALYMRTLEFQELHVRDVADKIDRI